MIRTIRPVTVDNRKQLTSRELAHSHQVVEHHGFIRVLVIDTGKVSHVWRCPSLESAERLVRRLKRFEALPAYVGPVVRLELN